MVFTSLYLVDQCVTTRFQTLFPYPSLEKFVSPPTFFLTHSRHPTLEYRTQLRLVGQLKKVRMRSDVPSVRLSNFRYSVPHLLIKDLYLMDYLLNPYLMSFLLLLLLKQKIFKLNSTVVLWVYLIRDLRNFKIPRVLSLLVPISTLKPSTSSSRYKLLNLFSLQWIHVLSHSSLFVAF